ncbi:Glycerol-3-phosphate dehydrogenase [NAD(P)+] [Striga asiatica]|uniref:Glycerol-3-phosphate dehydrogenase [NAD(P)+] n=1 Tax=Striga asiatica TaxID=4170 RepID=A0A5A7QF30_STRAF|nr:Glycerol-3-phosphate dehydrogenase [NAD(P)+] [Striga asiatica]
MDINNATEVDNEAEKVPSVRDEELASEDEAEAKKLQEDFNETYAKAPEVMHCEIEKLKQSQQQKTNFPSADSSTPHPYHHTSKFDMAAMRESAVEWVLVHEHPFPIFVKDGFNLMLKREIPE